MKDSRRCILNYLENTEVAKKNFKKVFLGEGLILITFKTYFIVPKANELKCYLVLNICISFSEANADF